MSTALTLARPYARAVFTLARDHGCLPAWSQALGFAAAAVLDPRVGAVLGNPRWQGAALVDLVRPPQADAMFGELLALLANNRRLELLPDIAAQFEALRAEEERVVRATVTAATAMDDAQVEQIRQALTRRFGRNVAIETAIDPALIGGAVIAAGDVVIDGSIRTKLARLGAALAQ
ncbi:MAG: F0F1 ATP synthase subunit delta [Gammaproteobacteria bacterium HGW-Gammaproteobacteria-4]|jgi:F-type H+-transporting ATPase subunit delta|nr:MAG: F0F1 ATP synthase subunit delta [Gammaproteobacteria bacterium HGW-Gammaproteobacteria-4]